MRARGTTRGKLENVDISGRETLEVTATVEPESEELVIFTRDSVFPITGGSPFPFMDGDLPPTLLLNKSALLAFTEFQIVANVVFVTFEGLTCIERRRPPLAVGNVSKIARGILELLNIKKLK